MRNTLACLLLLFTFNSVSSANSLTYQNFTGQLDYVTTNLGGANDTVSIPLIGNTATASYDSGILPGGSTGGRIFEGRSTAGALATFSSTGFTIDLNVTAESECVDNPTAGSCPSGVTTNGEMVFEFIPDMDMTLNLSGTWTGSDGGGFSIVDYFYFQLERETANPFNPEELITIDTNQATTTQESGIISESVNLLAGNIYTLSLFNKTDTISSNELPVVSDSGTFSLIANSVPEPSTMVMLLSSFGVMANYRHKA